VISTQFNSRTSTNHDSMLDFIQAWTRQSSTRESVAALALTSNSAKIRQENGVSHSFWPELVEAGLKVISDGFPPQSARAPSAPSPYICFVKNDFSNDYTNIEIHRSEKRNSHHLVNFRLSAVQRLGSALRELEWSSTRRMDKTESSPYIYLIGAQ
jgi:hypothetical protein